MVESTTLLQLFAGLTLLFSNGFFVTTEFAMTRVRQFDEAEFQEHRGLRRAWEMTEQLEIYLSGCQIGITISSVGLGFVAEPALAAVLDPAVRAAGLGSLLGGGGEAGHTALSVALALLVINLLHVIVGEQAPTYLGIERTKTVARYGAPLLYWWTRALGPIIRLADWVAKAILGVFGVEISRSWAEEEIEEGEDGAERPASRGELRSRMGTLLSRGELSDEREQEVINALEIGDVSVAEVMVEREGIVALSTEESIEANLELMTKRQHTRFPLVGESLEEFVGVVYTPEVLTNVDALRDGEVDIASVATPSVTVPADLPVSDLIDRFQAEHQEVAMVVDPDDESVVGLVTATDAFEAITGDLEDPLD
ncbi:hemolysin family protein [Halococcus sp. PRR34]|uniref:hemolysin family protein n=1 Tax=Halococcus sp. PRR34 TaxID=3020830 RepID=UPI0023621E7C|nr:hemolysin family protein [Halococcus sp. PRR34]